MMNRLAIFLLVAAAAFGQSQPSAQSILEADRAFNQATQQDRLEGWMSFMADNVVLFGQDPPVVGKHAVREFYQPQFSNPDFTLTWEAKNGEIQPSGRVGHTTGKWIMRTKNAKGEPVELHGTYLTVWGKQKDGSWKVIADGGSPDPL